MVYVATTVFSTLKYVLCVLTTVFSTLNWVVYVVLLCFHRIIEFMFLTLFSKTDHCGEVCVALRLGKHWNTNFHKQQVFWLSASVKVCFIVVSKSLYLLAAVLKDCMIFRIAF